MSSTKTVRGRVNATQIIEATSTSPLISNIATAINPTNALQQQYVPSLLKIESVVPSRLNAAATRNLQQQQLRANRALMTRSYSTLCGPASILNGTTVTTSIAATATTTTTIVNYKSVSKRINTNFPLQQQQRHHHRHKNHHDANERSSPTSKINNQQANSEATSVAIENGVHKVRRNQKEKEKQPDRINLGMPMPYDASSS